MAHSSHQSRRWRNRIPLAPWGWREVNGLGWPLLAGTVVLLWLGHIWAFVAVLPAILLGFVLYFFRDPPRSVPKGLGLFVSPADGKIVEISNLDHDAFIGGPAVRIGIFLSIFNVHINRAPARSRVLELRYKPGEFLNAMNPKSAERNESMWIGMEELAANDQPQRRIVVRQISGLIARRIVCQLAVDGVVDRGERFGMIKFGSRTELVLPHEDRLQVMVKIGDRVRAGGTVIARNKVVES